MNRKWQLLVPLSVALVTTSQAALQFTNLQPAVLSSTLNSVASDNQSSFFAVGQNSQGITATLDLTTWTTSTVVTNAPADGDLSAVTYGAGQFVAGGVNGSTFFSTDRTNWIRGSKANSLQATVSSLAHNASNGRFAAAAVFPLVSWSTDVASLWTAGTLTAPVSPFFSYHGVAAFGADSFLVCGDAGTLRRSTDGGVNWTELNPNVGNDVSLRAIASDGGQQLVAVGSSSRVLYSSDGGTTWATNSGIAAHFGSVSLNGIAFMNPGYIVVGDGGRVFTISDITTTNWTQDTPTGNNLLGVAHATGGADLGLSVMVGAGGTVIVAGTPPLAPINPINQTVCAGSPNPPLSVSVVGTDPLHPAATIAIDWFNAAGIRVATNTPTYIPTDTDPGGPNASAEYDYFAEARDLRTGFVSTNRTKVVLTINPRPTSVASLTGPSPICNGDSTTIQAVLTGIGPWNVTWSDGSNQTVNVSPATRIVTPANANPNAPLMNSYTVTALTDANCVANAGDRTGSAVVVVNPRPTSVVSLTGPSPICNGDSTTIQAALTGVGPWNVTWSDGTNQVVAVSPATRVVSLVNPNPNTALTSVFTVTALTDANCVANAGDRTGAATVVVNPRPTSVVSLTGLFSICNGDSTTVQAVLTGIGPWNVTWSDGTNQVVTASPATRIISPVNPNPNTRTTNVYSVTALTDANCTANPGDRTGSALVVVNPRPTSLVSLTGSSPICNGDSTTIQAALTGIGPWTVTWSDGTNQVVAASPATRSVTPVNPNPGTPLTNIYTVTALTDANCVANAGDRAGNAVVVINALPLLTSLSGDQTNCLGILNTISATIGGSAGPWNVTWSDGFTQNSVTSPFTRQLTPLLGTTNLSVTALTDALTGCVAPATNLAAFAATLTVENCATNPLTIRRESTNSVVVEWYGNLRLLRASDLTPPVTWSLIATGNPGGISRWTNLIVPPPPNNFFRLTNAP